MVEVFKTNVKKAPEAKKLITLLSRHYPGSKINFDLRDCDKVLRVEGYNVAATKIIGLIHEHGFACTALE